MICKIKSGYWCEPQICFSGSELARDMWFRDLRIFQCAMINDNDSSKLTIDNYLDEKSLHTSKQWLPSSCPLEQNDGIILFPSLAIGIAAASATKGTNCSSY
jgi:hypothetical protein